MPKSKVRKGRKPYVPKGTGRFGIPDPAALFLMIGQGTLDPQEEEFAAKMLFAEIDHGKRQDPELLQQFGKAWPPATWQDLVRLAQQSAQQLRSSTDGSTTEDDEWPYEHVPTITLPRTKD